MKFFLEIREKDMEFYDKEFVATQLYDDLRLDFWVGQRMALLLPHRSLHINSDHVFYYVRFVVN